MAYNDISKNFTYENGGTIDGDLALTTMAANTKIKNKASGQLYSKRSGYTNVFDKTNTYANYLKADEFGINTSGSGNGVASITYSTSGRKITQNLTTFTTPSDLATANNNLKSQAVGSITVSGRTVTYMNVNGQPLGSFQTQDNNTTYSAGTGLSLNGTTFSVSQELIDKVLPIGSYIQFSGSQAPAGFLVCNGSAVSRTTYSRLFAVIGTTYGSGNGSTTFNLPNLIDRFLQGSSTSGTVKNAGLPNITGSASELYGVTPSISASGAMYQVYLRDDDLHGADDSYKQCNFALGFDASRSSAVYGRSSTVQPNAITCLICIKY